MEFEGLGCYVVSEKPLRYDEFVDRGFWIFKLCEYDATPASNMAEVFGS